jgi:mannitol-1-/sugar-/sorbitol-6-/2-deoxyglucose-6-phosphatase
MINTVIFDMDGLLVDSEPHWQEAGIEYLKQFGVTLTVEEYHVTTGLRTKEWLEYWFNYFGIDMKHAKDAGGKIEDMAVEKIRHGAREMEGVQEILSFFESKNFTIGLATSSSHRLIDVVVDKLGIRSYFKSFSSAEHLLFSKPHPEVYLNCARLLGSAPTECICFEDSFNGMISAKAARMKCVVVPEPGFFEQEKWAAADLKIPSLARFDNSHLSGFLNGMASKPQKK